MVWMRLFYYTVTLHIVYSLYNYMIIIVMIHNKEKGLCYIVELSAFIILLLHSENKSLKRTPKCIE